jgi:hypothetical protein
MKTQVRNYEYEFATLIYLILVIPFLSNLPVSESVYFWYEAESWNKVFNNSWHPPFYLIILRLFKLFTNNAIWGGYIPGLLSVVISGWLIKKVILENFTNTIRTGNILLILICYYSLPVIIQGTFILDIDNTVLTPVLILLTYCGIRWHKNNNKTNLIVLGLILFLSLWIKMTTPLIWMSSFFVFLLVRKKIKNIIYKILPLFIIVLIAFWFSYGFLYTKLILSDIGSFQFSGAKALDLILGKNTFQNSFDHLMFSLVSNTGAIMIWSSPILILLLLTPIPKNIIKLNDLQILCLINVLFIYIAYTFVLKIQATAGFPKYHYPMYAFLLILVSNYLIRIEVNFNWYVLSTAVMLTTLYIYFIGDPIINFYIFGREKKYYDIIKYFGILLFIITLFVIAIKFLLLKINLNESLLLPIVLTLIITNTASWVSRANANYSTNYWYGTKGILETIIFSNKLPKDKTVYFPFMGLFLKERGNLTPYGDIKNDDFTKPNSDYIIMTSRLIDSGNWFFKRDYLEKKYSLSKKMFDFEILVNNER